MSRAFIPLFAALLVAACGPAPESPPPSQHWQRIDAAGHIMSSDHDAAHRCVLDTATGLMWQVHTEDPGLHHSGNRYSWYSEDRQVNMGEPGLADGGTCSGSGCDTASLVEALDRERLCAQASWRVPTREELMSLGEAERRGSGQIVDTAFFPAAIAGEYWASETFRLYPQSAWAVNFANGLDRADRKSEPKAVRLVADAQTSNEKTEREE